MLTLAALPKAFKGQFGVIQRNAIKSWTLLEPKPEIILFGEDKGVADICQEFGLRHVPQVKFTNDGPPLLGDVLDITRREATNELVCYVNADIILLNDFIQAVREASSVRPKFLIVSRRWDVKLDDLWNFELADWELQLRAYVHEHGTQAPPPGNSDYFVFPRQLWKSIAPLVIGRGWWDHWLVYEARRLGAAVVDASQSVMVIHQNHDHLLNPSPADLKRWRHAVNTNLEIAGPHAKRFTLLDSTHRLTSQGITRNVSFRRCIRSLDTLPLFHPILCLPMRLLQAPLKLVRTIAKNFRRRADPSYRILDWVISHLPEDGLVGVLGLAEAADASDFDHSRGQLLTHNLIWGGFPSIVYDPAPKVMDQARRRLQGPITFASSIDDCLRNSDILLIAALRNDIRPMLCDALSRGNSRCTVVDCCGMFETPELAGRTQTSLQQVSFSW